MPYEHRDWVEINDDAYGTLNTNSEIELKTSMLAKVYLIIVMNIY